MATMQQSKPAGVRSNFDWDNLLSRAYTINWEVVAYTVILVLAVLTRFWNLGDRVMSHDESLHTYYSWRLYDAGDFQHTPLMHGPVLFHAVAFFYFLFGDSDFSARMYAAVLGIGIVMFPLLFRRYLGRLGGVLAAFGLLISPMMMYYSRYIREDIPNIFYLLVMIYGLAQYLDHERPRQMRYLILFSGAMLLMMASKETGFMYIAIFGSFFLFYWIMRVLQELPLRHRAPQALGWRPPILQQVFGHLLALGAIVMLGFLFGELLYLWQYASMNWVWIALGVGLVLLVRLVVLAWDTLMITLRRNQSMDVINLALVFLAILGVLLGLFGAYRYHVNDSQINQIIADQQKLSLDPLAQISTSADDLEPTRDARQIAAVMGVVGLAAAMLTLSALVFTKFLAANEDGSVNRAGVSWLLITLGVMAAIAFVMSLLKWITSSTFANILDDIADKNSTKHTLLDLTAMAILFIAFYSIGFIRSYIARERRPGIPQMFTEGLARGKSAVFLIMVGTILGGVLSLHIFSVLDVIRPEEVLTEAPAPLDPVTNLPIEQEDPEIILNVAMGNALLTWVGLPILGAIGLVLIAALVKTPANMPMPWQDIMGVILVATLVGGVLIFAERRSHLKEEAATDAPVANTPDQEGSSAVEDYDNTLIYLSALLSLVASAVVIIWRILLPDSWAYLNRQPSFDVLIMMGTLILPWVSALPIWLGGYTLDAAPLPGDTVEVSLVILFCWLFLTTAVGLSWNWRYWLICTGVFTGLFLFFFTTMFTNGPGVFTGVVGSLGYWLEQQGVRRGSQPQYYYTWIEMPIYEYLPMILASLAGISGMVQFFGWRVQSMQAEKREADEQVAAERHVKTGPLDMERLLQEQPALEQLRSVSLEADDPEIEIDAELEAVESPFWARPYDPDEEQAMRTGYREWIGGLPFLAMLGYWAIIIFVALTYAGEKMPWLSTHITVPLIMISGWYAGRIIEKIEWDALLQGGWALLLVLVPVFVIAMVEVFWPLMGGDQPFQGMQQGSLHITYAWLAALAVMLGVGYFIVRLMTRIGFAQTRRIAFAAVAGILAVLTARSATVAAFQNYDYPTEYLVYAHSGPAVKQTLAQIEYIANRLNEGTEMKIAFDDDSSWPMTWYLRDYNGAFFAGEASSLESNPGVLDGARVVIVGSRKNAAAESILGNEYYRFDYIRLWWPMQEYFHLNYDRITNLFEGDESATAEMFRHAIWNIWWDRDYKLYGQAQCVESRVYQCDTEPDRGACYNRIQGECLEDDRYALGSWPVSDAMYVYVDKEIAAQIWDAGIGGESVSNREPVDAVSQLYRDITPITTFGADYNLSGPRGIEVGPDGNIYVADTNNSRIIVFDENGELVNLFGVPTTDENNGLGTLFQPWGVAVGADGRVYVADTWNHRVQVFNPDGTALTTWGYYGTPDDKPGDPFALWGPRDIEVDVEGNVLVADTGGKRIRVYTADGEWVRDIGLGAGAGLGQLEEPVGVAVNPISGHVFVADTWNRRIQEFDEDGLALRTFEVPMWFDSRTSPDRPYIAVSPDGTLLAIADMNSTGRNDGPRIVIYDLGGAPLLALNAPDVNIDAGEHGIRVVGGLAFGDDGSLYALDVDTGRVVRFPPLPVFGSIMPDPINGVVLPESSGGETLGQSVGASENMPFSMDEVQIELPTEEITAEPTEEVTEAVTDEPTDLPTEESTDLPTEESTEDAAG